MLLRIDPYHPKYVEIEVSQFDSDSEVECKIAKLITHEEIRRSKLPERKIIAEMVMKMRKVLRLSLQQLSRG